MPGIVNLAVDNIEHYANSSSPSAIAHSFETITGKQESGAPSDLRSIIITLGLVATGMYLLFALLKGLFLFFTRQTVIVMSRLIEYDLKNEIYDKYQALSMSFYKRNNTGDLMNRISEDVGKVRMYLGPAIMYTINLVVLFIMVITSMIQINAELTLYVLTPLPIMSFLVYKISGVINKKSEATQRQQSRLSTFVQEAFSGIRVLKAYNREKYFEDNFEEETVLYQKASLSLVKVNATFMPIIVMLIGLSTIITIYIGGLKSISGSIDMGDIVQFVIYVNMLTWPFVSVGWVTSLVQRAAASQERINEFLEQESDIQMIDSPKEFKSGDIEFDHVTFIYPESGIKALDDVSFTIEQGKTLAITGKTGSGKSTIANLLCRLYDVNDGKITFANDNITDLDVNELRYKIGYAPQEVFLFSDTITNNIAFGDKQETTPFELVEQAAKEADIYDNILGFEEGFNTKVGERGITLSGGQKQRISIARAIIKRPEILIFDDCLSAVDTKTEEAILGNLRRIMKNRTSVLISHRISTLKDADHILVLEDGRIIEQGNHEELLQLKGSYFETYQKQLLEEKLD